MVALNNLNDRMIALETPPRFEEGDLSVLSPSVLSPSVLSPTDRAILDNAASFFGVHRVVAETLASKDAGIENIDPTTGRERIKLDRPAFSKQEAVLTGT